MRGVSGIILPSSSFSPTEDECCGETTTRAAREPAALLLLYVTCLGQGRLPLGGGGAR